MHLLTASTSKFAQQANASTYTLTRERTHSHDHSGHIWLFQHVHLAPPSPKQVFN